MHTEAPAAEALPVKHPVPYIERPPTALTLEYCFLSRDEPCQAPMRVYADDAGFDVYVSRTMQIMPGCWGTVCTNLAVRIPAGFWGFIQARGATHRKRKLFVASGKIDQGYHGEVTASCFNPTDSTVVIRAGESLFQFVLMPLNIPLLREVESFPKAELSTDAAAVRGDKGLGY